MKFNNTAKKKLHNFNNFFIFLKKNNLRLHRNTSQWTSVLAKAD